jgi:hypothetical protein
MMKGGNMKESTRALTRASILGAEQLTELMKAMHAVVAETPIQEGPPMREVKRQLKESMRTRAQIQCEGEIRALNSLLDSLLPDEG